MTLVSVMLDNARRQLQARQFAAAGAIARDVLKKAPGNADALEMLGILGLESKSFAEAADFFARAVKVRPGAVELRYNLSLALNSAGRHAEAERPAREAVARRPESAAFRMHLGLVLGALHKVEEAERELRRACELEPGSAKCWFNLGGHQLNTGRKDAALESYRKAEALDPSNPKVLAVLGKALQDNGRAWEGLRVLRRAHEAGPRDPDALATLGRVLTDLGQGEEGCRLVAEALALTPGSRRRRQSLVMLLNYISDDGVMLKEQHREFGERMERAVAPLPAPGNRRDPERTLRVGIMSGDLREHSCSYFLSPLFAALPRDGFEVWGLATVTNEDAVTARLKGEADGWIGLGLLNGEQACRAIREAEIDILIECSGHTEGNRLDICAMRPAPLQMTYLGYPNTTGLTRIDYRIVDPITDPPGAEAFCVERLLRVAEGKCLWCFRPSVEAPGVGEGPAARTGTVTIGCFNNLSKITPGAVEAWAEILRRVPGATLLLKNKWLHDAGTMGWFRGLFEARGVDGARISAVGYTKTTADHLRAYELIDFQLDTFPYNGTTTTCESLWQGVPAVAVKGRVHAAKVSECLLHHAGLGELVSDDVAGYVETAVALAHDPARLSSLRRSLRDRMSASVLRDERGYGEGFGEALRRAWREWCRG